MKRKWITTFLFIATFFAMNGKSIQGSFSNGIQNKENESSNYENPTLDPLSPTIDKNMSNAVNALFNAKEILMDQLSIKIYPDYQKKEEQLTLSLSNLDIDLSNSNTLSTNFSCQARILFKGFDETFDIEYQADDYLYLSHKKGNAFKVSFPQTLSDLFTLLNALGTNITLNESEKNVSIISLLEYIKKANTYEKENNTSDSGFSYALSLPDKTIGNTTINNLSLSLYADENNVPTRILTEKDILLSSNSNEIGISLEGDFDQLREVSTYSKRNRSSQDISENTSCLFSTLTDFFKGEYSQNKESDKKQISIQISGELNKKTSSDTTSVSSLEGLLKADLSDVFANEEMGEYSLSLSQKEISTQKKLNDISLYYKKNNLYLALNDIFKGKISDSKLSDVFSTISKISNLIAFKEIDKELNLVFNIVKPSDLSKLLNGDFSILSKLLKGYQFSNNSLSLSVDKDVVGLKEDLTLSFRFQENEKGEKELCDILLDKVSFDEISIQNLSFKIQTFTEIQKPVEEEYPSYDRNLNLFDSLSDIISTKRVSADYSLIFTDQQNVTFNAEGSLSADVSNSTIDINSDNKVLHTDSGNYYLSFDLPQEKNSKDILGQGIEMYYSGAEKNLYFGFEYDQNNKFDSLKDSPLYVFRNSLEASDIKDMLSLIDSKVEDSSQNTSKSISSMSDILSAIANSDKFKMLKSDLANSLSLKELDGVLKIEKDPSDNILLTLDPSAFLKDTKYSKNTSDITLTISSEKEIVSLSCKGQIDGCKLTFNININDKQKDYSKFNTTDYPKITDASKLLSSLVSLPTDLEQFDLSISGKIQNEEKSIPSVEILKDSGISVNLKDKAEISGIVNIKHPDLNDNSKLIDGSQKLEFNYQQEEETIFDNNKNQTKNGQFLLEYNDNMHVKMQKSDIFDILKTISSVDNEENLLYRYLKFLNSAVQSSGSPLMDIINGKALSTSGIFAYPYFKSITFHEGYISIKVDPKLVKSDAEEGSDATLKITFDTLKKKIQSASIDAKYIKDGQTQNIDLNLSLDTNHMESYKRNPITDSSKSGENNNILLYEDSTQGKFVNINGFKILLQSAVNTTENNFMEISGNLSIGLSLFSAKFSDLITVNASAYAAIYVKDETANVYLRINAGNKKITEDNYCVSEFFIQEKKVYVNQTRTNRKYVAFSGYQYTTSATAYETDSDNITKNIAYYILDFALNLKSYKVIGISAGSIALNEIYKAMNNTSSSSTTINSDFSNVLKAENSQVDEQNKTIALDLNLNSFLSVDSLFIPSLKLTIQYQGNGSQTLLSNVKIDGELEALSVVKIKIQSSETQNKFTLTNLKNITLEEAKTNYLQRYYEYQKRFEEEYPIHTLYRISAISDDGKLTTTGDIFTDHTYTNKGSISNSCKDDFFIYYS